jgi:hypothetical protein
MSFIREFPFDLTDDEVREYSEQMARGVQDLEAMKESKRVECKRRGDEIKVLQEQVNDLAGKVDSGVEMREVNCEWQKNHTEATMELTRLDTMMVIESRPMDDEERQMPLEEENAGGPPAEIPVNETKAA